MITIEFRTLMEVNVDPQRRCYYGCHAKTEGQWTEWRVMERVPDEAIAARRLAFWRDLNAYAVKERGVANTLTEYRGVSDAKADT